MAKVVVVGFAPTADNVDCQVVDALAVELFSRDLDDLAIELVQACEGSFNMATHPERGDAIDAIFPGVQLVVALNILGVSKIPGGRSPTSGGYLYNRENGLMLDKSLSVGAMFACFGAEQPWFSKASFNKKELGFSGSNLFLYEKEGT